MGLPSVLVVLVAVPVVGVQAMALVGKSAHVVNAPPESLRQEMQWQWVRRRGSLLEVKEVLEQRQLPFRRMGGGGMMETFLVYKYVRNYLCLMRGCMANAECL